MYRFAIVAPMLAGWFYMLQYGGQWLVASVFAVVVGFAVYEHAALVAPTMNRKIVLAAALTTGAAPFVRLAGNPIAPSLLLLVTTMCLGAAVLLVFPYQVGSKRALEQQSLLVSGIWYAFSLVALFEIFVTFGRAHTMLVCAATWGRDISAAAAGSLWRRGHAITPVSPRKTWEGAACGAAAAGLVVFSLCHFVLEIDLSFAGFLVMVTVVSVGGQVGDLYESALKRAAGVKDSGRTLSSHQGGILDSFDGFTAVAPALALWFWVDA